MARSSPQSFEKRQRERRKQLKRAEKLERRLIRNEEKRLAKAEGDGEPIDTTAIEDDSENEEMERDSTERGTEQSVDEPRAEG